jgi:LacI family transcriptional regulator
MQNQAKLIAIAYDFDLRHAAEIFSGVSDFIREQAKNWQLLPLGYGFESRLMDLVDAGQIAGVIGTFVSDEWLKGVTRRSVACINLFNLSQIVSVSSVGLDDAALGDCAATHLLEQGARSFTFIGQDEAYSNRLRRRSFSDRLPDGQFVKINARAPRTAQLHALASQPKPIGVLCTRDRIARELAQLAPQYDLLCGKNLLLVGIGNEPSESTFAGIGLSSFEIPAREIGHAAASLMVEALDPTNAKEPFQNIQLKATLFARESTLSSKSARIAERAKKLIEDSLADPGLHIDWIAERVGTSRRSLELTLKRQLGTSPYQLISANRLQKAKSLLRQTSLPIGEIGQRCGYPEPHHFSAWFKKKCGLAPKDFRTSHGSTEPGAPSELTNLRRNLKK